MANSRKGKHAAPEKNDSVKSPAETPLGSQQTTVMPATPVAFNQVDSSEYGMVNSFEGMKKARKNKKKVAGIAIGVVLLVLLVAYAAGAIFFSNFFYPATTMGSHNVSLQSRADVAAQLDKDGDNFNLAVSGDGLNFTISAKEAGVSINGDTVAMQGLNQQNVFLWPVELFGVHDVTEVLAASYNQSGLEPIVAKHIEEFNATAIDPVNATIEYSEKSKGFVVKPEVAGTKIDQARVMKVIDDAILDFGSTVKLGDEELVQPTVLEDDARLKTACESANAYAKANLTLVLGENAVPAGTIDGTQISQWIKLSPELTVTFDEEAMNAWVEDLAVKMDSAGSSRTYTRPDGKVFSVSGGTYGWEIDSESLVQQVKDGISAGKTATITVATISEGVSYSPGAQDWGAYADVDLTEQHARFYDTSGALVWESDVVTGSPGAHATTEGVWVLFNKESPSVLKGDIQQSTGQPEYETTVQYWMAFTYSGIGFHDATWQSAFGGTRYADGYGSHGCVNLPYSAAQELYGIISVGNAVVVHS